MAKKKLGKPLNLTDEQLDEMAMITPEDIERAKAFGQKYASKTGKDLLKTKKTKDA